MTKLSKKPIPPEQFGNYVNNLWSAFTLMDSKADIRLLFRGLFTHTEYKMFAKRLEIARRLLEGESYHSIQNALRVTPNTINRLSSILVEKGEGLRKAHGKLLALENKYRVIQQQRQKNLENPFRKKLYRKTVLGTALKVAAVKVDWVISRSLKHRTARKSLSV